MKLFRRKPRNKASAEAKEAKKTQPAQEQPEQQPVEKEPYTSLAEALRGEVVDDGRSRETVFYKPGGNVIVATVGYAIHVAFRVSKSNFADRFQWSDEVDADLSAIPTELNGYDLIDLCSAIEDEQTQGALQNIFRAYSIALLRDLDENFDKVRRIRTQPQAEGKPTDQIKNTNILNDNVQTFDLSYLDNAARNTLSALALDDVAMDQIALVMKTPAFKPSTAEEKLLFTVASRELTLHDAHESSDLFLWSDLMTALQHLFMEQVITFEHPGRTVSDDELSAQLAEQFTTAPEPEPEPEVVAPQEPVEYEPILNTVLPETEQDHVEEPVAAPPVSAHMAPEYIAPEPSPEPEITPPAPGTVVETPQEPTPVDQQEPVIEFEPTVEHEAPAVDSSPAIDLDVSEVFAELDAEEHAADEPTDEPAVEHQTTEEEPSLDEMSLPDIDFDLDNTPTASTFTPADIHTLMQEKKDDGTQVEEPIIDFPSVSDADTSTPIYDATFGSKQHDTEPETPDHDDTSELDIPEKRLENGESAFYLDDDMLQQPSAPSGRAPLFERLSKQHGIHLEDQ